MIQTIRRGVIDQYNGFTFSRSSTAYDTKGRFYLPNNARFVDGGIMVEEGTTNKLSANQSSVETDTTGFAALAGATILRDTTKAWHGVACLKVVTPGATTGEGFETTSVEVTASQPWTASVYLQGVGTVVLVIQERDSNDTLVGETVSSVITLADSWQRFSITRGFGASGVKARLVVRTNTAQAITFYADGLQIE